MGISHKSESRPPCAFQMADTKNNPRRPEKQSMLGLCTPLTVNTSPEYLLQAIRRPVVRFSGTGAAMPCHQSKRYSGGMRSAHGVQRASIDSFQLSSFDCFSLRTRSQHGHCLVTSWSVLVTRSALTTALTVLRFAALCCTRHQKAESPTHGRASIWCNWLSVHRHIASGHQVHGHANSAAQPVALASGYAHGAGEVVTLGCAI